MQAVEQAHRYGALFQGATLHVIDAGVDTGTILAQTILPVGVDSPASFRHRMSFLQKVLVTLILFEWLHARRIGPNKETGFFIAPRGLGMHAQINPTLQDPNLIARFMDFQLEEFQTKLYHLP